MYMYACMYVCMYVCTYVRMYVCMYVRMYVCMYVCMYAVYFKTPSHQKMFLYALLSLSLIIYFLSSLHQVK